MPTPLTFSMISLIYFMWTSTLTRTISPLQICVRRRKRGQPLPNSTWCLVLLYVPMVSMSPVHRREFPTFGTLGYRFNTSAWTLFNKNKWTYPYQISVNDVITKISYVWMKLLSVYPYLCDPLCCARGIEGSHRPRESSMASQNPFVKRNICNSFEKYWPHMGCQI